jgi:glucose/arabinose dehydrogenase
MEFAPDGRLFVSEQAGKVRVIKNNALLATPFLDITSQVDSAGERGVFGIAFDPNFASNHYVYIYYTAKTPTPHNRVSRFTANGDIAMAGSETVIIDLTPVGVSTFHNGGAIHFGKDGKLYISTGEANISDNADSFQNLLGKILRINADGSIPSDNPFYNTASGSNRAIWALGLRNPYSFSVQPGTGRILINDVGENSWEEINEGIAGSHYGWPNTEGPTSNPNYRSPIFAYPHDMNGIGGCAITGGTFYNPDVAQFPGPVMGRYFYTDYCNGTIRYLTEAGTPSLFALGISSPVDLKVSSDGSLYYLARGSGGQSGDFRSNTGVVSKISYVATQPPPPGNDVSLSDLEWVSATNGWGPVERDRSNGEQGSGDGGAITLDRVTYAKGLGTHAPSEIIYNLGGNYTNFISDLGIDGEVDTRGSVTFEVWADGVKIFDSGLQKGSYLPLSVNLNVTGRQQLRLVVTDGATDGVFSDHADWAGARLTKTAVPNPMITTDPVSQTVALAQPVTFQCGATGAGPLSYQWQGNERDIYQATSSSYTIPSTVVGNDGDRYRCIVSNSYGKTTSNEATVTIGSNQSPTARILTPQAGTLYKGGDTIRFSGEGTDPEDVSIGHALFTWEVVFFHDTHTHPFLGPLTNISGGQFQIPTIGETSTNVWFRIYLTVKDSFGATNTTFVDIFPQKSTMMFATNPAGLQFTLDGQPRTAPLAVEGVVGMNRTLGVVSPQTVNGTTYFFNSWADGVSTPTRTITTQASNTTYTANFTMQPAPSPTPTPVPTPPPALSDDFNDNARDAGKWILGTLNRPASDFDQQVIVAERNQRLEIVPRANVTGHHYNGYVSAALWNLTNGSASVEVVQTAASGPSTIFAMGTDSNNWFRFVVEDGRLYFQWDTPFGRDTGESILYSATAHRYWRFRHEPAGNLIVFETSPDGTNWNVQRSTASRMPITALRVELSAGTFGGVSGPGTAIFDNFKLESPNASAAPIIEFTSGFVRVNENDLSGVATVTVTRGGNVLAAASVDYATSDTFGDAPCQNNFGSNASGRCDYTPVVGTLRFAPGEQSKTVQIPLINDAYIEPGEIFTLTLRNPVGASLGAFSSSSIQILSDDSQTLPQNPIEDQSFFIRQQYIDFLGRVVEPAGFQFWDNRMNNCPAGQICDRIDTSLRFFQSDEFQERGFYVYRLYDEVLGRLPRYAEFVPDMARLNGPQTVAEQRLSKDAYLLNFINKAEFRSLYGQYLSSDGLTAVNAAGFVNALCARAGITPASKQTLINNLQSGARDPAHTVEDFILSPELSAVGTRFYDRGFITMQYFGYLKRDPDSAGFDFWVGQLIGPNAPHRQDYRFMVGGFLQSDEYHFRFARISAP